VKGRAKGPSPLTFQVNNISLPPILADLFIVRPNPEPGTELINVKKLLMGFPAFTVHKNYRYENDQGLFE
jgi:hypothetical protein